MNKLPLGVAKLQEYGDRSSAYVVHCECISPNHQHLLFVDYDDDMKLSAVSLYIDTKTDWKNKWKVLWRLLTKGYVEYNAELMLTGKQAESYAKILRGEI